MIFRIAKFPGLALQLRELTVVLMQYHWQLLASKPVIGFSLVTGQDFFVLPAVLILSSYHLSSVSPRWGRILTHPARPFSSYSNPILILEFYAVCRRAGLLCFKFTARLGVLLEWCPFVERHNSGCIIACRCSLCSLIDNFGFQGNVIPKDIILFWTWYDHDFESADTTYRIIWQYDILTPVLDWDPYFYSNHLLMTLWHNDLMISKILPVESISCVRHQIWLPWTLLSVKGKGRNKVRETVTFYEGTGTPIVRERMPIAIQGLKSTIEGTETYCSWRMPIAIQGLRSSKWRG